MAFLSSFEGAKSSAIILSLLETAKRNGLDSEKYLTYLLEKLPNEESFAKKAVLEAYLPWSETVQADCKIRKESPKSSDFGDFQYTSLLGAYSETVQADL